MKMDNPRKRNFEDYLGKIVQGNEANFKIGALEKMKNLMLLQLNYVTFSGKYKKLSKKLRLLRWHGFSLKSIPGDIPLKKLVVLDMSYSKLKLVWDDFKCIESLKILNLSYSFELLKTPDFGGLPGLESLILKGCISLSKVDESIAYLKELVLLDLTDCRSLKNNVPCLPRSLVSLEMSGCPNIGSVGGFRCLGSTSLPSLLVKLNISNCNLSDSSFSNDWSHLVSLEVLRIDGNNVTYLPKCIQTLPRLHFLYANDCPQMQSILGLPKTLNFLDIVNNVSLKKIVPLDKYLSVDISGSISLCGMEGWYKWQSIDKVEWKVIRNMGLGMELGLDYSKQKVLFEYGIFSTWVTWATEKPIPSCFFTYKERGPQISFIVPSHPHPHPHPHPHGIISGFNLCLVISPILYWLLHLRIQVYNKTKDLKWNYFPGSFFNDEEEKKGWWLSVWRCGNLLEDGDGDEIILHIYDRYAKDLIYDDEVDENDIEKHDGETQETNHNVVSAYDDEMRWTDRMVTEISDCAHTGMTYSFGDYRVMGYDNGFVSGGYGDRCLCKTKGEMTAN